MSCSISAVTRRAAGVGALELLFWDCGGVGLRLAFGGEVPEALPLLTAAAYDGGVAENCGRGVKGTDGTVPFAARWMALLMRVQLPLVWLDDLWK